MSFCYFRFRLFLITLVILSSFCLHASKIEKGFEALRKNDYFKAKTIFSEINESAYNPYACFGLATIYSRQDNPFSNSDSASKYVGIAFNLFRILDKPIQIEGLKIDPMIILALADTIADRQLQLIKRESTVTKFNKLLASNYLASQGIISEAVYLRDEIEFNDMMVANKSDSTKKFIFTHPQSNFFIEAMLLRERQLFDELTYNNKTESFKYFLKKYPNNALQNTAYQKLLEIYKQKSDIEGLKSFIFDYPNAPQNLEAWKLLFSLSVRSFSNSELKKFLEDYPAFPLKKSILKELELNNVAFFPYQKKELFGYVGADGRLLISPVYESVTDFSEGLAVVSRNDTVFFINKENKNLFGKVFTEAFTFKNGIAPVKQNGKWFFVNRQGQSISKTYDEIGELSNSIYIIKINGKYGAADQFGQTVIEPKFSKLGDFKNDFAYYIEDNKYGFISRAGIQHKAEFDWISDFNNKQVAVVKKDNKYGLVNAAGKKILEPQYDLVLKTNTSVFIVVANNNYGFFSSEGCFLSQVSYEFSKEKPAEFYTNGDYFKLIKKGAQSLSDKNGRTLITFDTYDEINFFSDGLMRVRKDLKKEPRYGYLDKKLNMVIPLKYQTAGDFVDSVALVKNKNKFIMLNYVGIEIFSSDFELKKLSAHYYLMDDGFKQLINQQGGIVYADIERVQVLNPWLIVVTLGSGEIKLLYD